MSLPVQIIVHGSKASVAIEQMCGPFAGSQQGSPLWLQVYEGKPAFAGLVAADVAAMRRARGHEGGYVRIVVAETAQALTAILGRLPVMVPADLAIAIVLATGHELELRPASMQLHTVFVVPEAVGRRNLAPGDRIEAACNLAAAISDRMRSDGARDELKIWQPEHKLQFALCTAGRFHAAAVQRVLGERLAAQVAQAVNELVEAGENGDGAHLPDLQPQDKDLGQRAKAIGAAAADRIVDARTLPAEAVLLARAQVELDGLPNTVHELVTEAGRQAREESTVWRDGLRNAVDARLGLDGLKAVGPLRHGLGTLQRRLDSRIADASTKATPQPAGARDEQSARLSAPSSEAARAAANDLLRHEAEREDSTALFGAWALVLATLTVVCLQPVVAAWSSPSASQATVAPALATAGSAVGPLPSPGGLRLHPQVLYSAALGASVLGAAIALAFGRRRTAQARHGLLVEAAETALQSYKEAWAVSLESQVQRIAAQLRLRVLRQAKRAVDDELRRLDVVYRSGRDLQARFDPHKAAWVPPPPAAFSHALQLPEGFYLQAEQPQAIAQLATELDDEVRRPTWRSLLTCVDAELLLDRCREVYSAYRQRIPFEGKPALRDLVAPEALAAIVRMHTAMHGDLGGRSIVLAPTALSTALRDYCAHQQIDFVGGASDLYAAQTRPVELVP